MSVGHRHAQARTEAELLQVLGEGDTPKLFQKRKALSTSYDIPYAGGISVDGSQIYIDRTLYKAIMDGRLAVRGLSAKQIISAWQEHEGTEWAIDAGDNPVDTYSGSHGFATAKENHAVKLMGVDPAKYEAEIFPWLTQCEARFRRLGDKADPPKDLWCGPISENASKDDKEILRICRAKNVTDAFKLPKTDVHYGIGDEKCRDCAMYQKPDRDMSQCDLISGMVRWNRRCDRYVERKK